MNEHLTVAVALVMVAICSITAVGALPVLAIAAARGDSRGAFRFGAVILVVLVLGITLAAVIGSVPDAYSRFS